MADLSGFADAAAKIGIALRGHGKSNLMASHAFRMFRVFGLLQSPSGKQRAWARREIKRHKLERSDG